MAFTLEHTATHRNTTYRLSVTSEEGSLTLDLHGASPDGDVASGTIRLPVTGSAEAARLITRALTAASAFDGTRKRGTAPNSHAPWTLDQDTALRADWEAYPESTKAATAIRELAAARQRSSASIRARLSRIGCDPDVPGRLLTPETATLIGRPPPTK
ncbi:hypothetical protein [Actinokineospora sp. NPDC004072]